MLQALSKKGNMIMLHTMTKIEIEKWKQESFFCPACKQQVIIKAGTKVIPHFAHRSITNCPNHEGGEGAYHEKGKLLLYNWLIHQKLDVQLEAFIPEINQRPDLLLKLNRKRIAIEYQCARVPVEQIRQRSAGYARAGIIPIWILGNNLLKRQTGKHLKIDTFSQQFIHQFSSDTPLILFYFCPHTLQFITFQDIFLTQTRQGIGKLNVKSLNQMNFTHLFMENSFTQLELYQLWKKEKFRFRLKPAKHLYGKELAWRQWLYLKGTHLEYLPSIIHLPIPAQYQMKTQVWDWQSRVVIDLLAPLPTGSQISITSVEHFLRKQLLSPLYFPLIHSTEKPVTQYLQLLAHLDIMKQTTAHSFIKINEIKFHKNIDAALKADEAMMNYSLSKASNKIQA
ncbi:competence protein CoiA [Virgibacillus sp. CBA3643]|uniref:competence protein CoiA n=1 Tax=Virgibacillus sp. CBA3643 TaxID=2942278 RepID=UPI0035A26DAC